MAQQSSSQESCSDTITRNKPDTIKHEENSIEGGMKKLKVEDEMKGKIDFYYWYKIVTDTGIVLAYIVSYWDNKL
jgi:hypothetical protein